MKEIEEKFEVENERQLVDKLKKLGFRKERRVLQIDIPLSQIFYKNNHSFIRIRSLPKEKIVEITIKGRPKLILDWSNVRDEYTIKTEKGLDEVLGFFRLAGYLPMGEVRKNRTIYHKSSVEIVIDKVSRLGTFIEIEVKKNKDALEVLDVMKKQLMLKNEVKAGYFDLINKNAAEVFYSIVRNLNRDKILVKRNKKLNIKKVDENVIEIKEIGSYFIGFPSGIELTRSDEYIMITKI